MNDTKDITKIYQDVTVAGPDRYGQPTPNYECHQVKFTLFITEPKYFFGNYSTFQMFIG